MGDDTRTAGAGDLSGAEAGLSLLLYFGEPWAGLKDQNAVRVAIPLGESCRVCLERISAGDRGYLCATLTEDHSSAVAAVHIECEALGMFGHDFGVCSCTGFDTTARASALVLWKRLNDFSFSIGHR